MTSERPSGERPVATGIASGSLGTGTAVDEETTLMAVPEIPEPSQPPEMATPVSATATAPAAAPASGADPVHADAPKHATAPATPARRVSARRDPYRPIGIALAAILVALAGFAALSSGGDSPIDAGAAPDASQTLAPGASSDAGGDGDQDNGDGGGGKGNCNGRGNDPCDREGGGGD